MRRLVTTVALLLVIGGPGGQVATAAEGTASAGHVFQPDEGDRLSFCDAPGLTVNIKVDSVTAGATQFAMGTAHLTGTNTGTHAEQDTKSSLSTRVETECSSGTSGSRRNPARPCTFPMASYMGLSPTRRLPCVLCGSSRRRGWRNGSEKAASRVCNSVLRLRPDARSRASRPDNSFKPKPLRGSARLNFRR